MMQLHEFQDQLWTKPRAINRLQVRIKRLFLVHPKQQQQQTTQQLHCVQDKAKQLDESAASLRKVDVVELLQQEVSAPRQHSDKLDVQILLSTDANEFGTDPVPPNKGVISNIALIAESIDYDSYCRQSLNVVRMYSGLIILLCYGSVLMEFVNNIMSDPESGFLMRLQLRNGEHKAVDTPSVESNPSVGSSSLAQVSQSVGLTCKTCF